MDNSWESFKREYFSNMTDDEREEYRSIYAEYRRKLDEEKGGDK